MTLRTLASTQCLICWLIICGASLDGFAATHAQEQATGNQSHLSSACATPPLSRSIRVANNAPYQRPVFRAPQINAQSSDARPLNERPLSIDLDSEEFDSEFESQAFKQPSATSLPELNPIGSRSRHSGIPKLNSPRKLKPAPGVNQNSAPSPDTDSVVADPPPPTDDRQLSTNVDANNRPVVDVGRFEDFSGGVRMKISDATYGANGTYGAAIGNASHFPDSIVCNPQSNSRFREGPLLPLGFGRNALRSSIRSSLRSSFPTPGPEQPGQFADSCGCDSVSVLAPTVVARNVQRTGPFATPNLSRAEYEFGAGERVATAPGYLPASQEPLMSNVATYNISDDEPLPESTPEQNAPEERSKKQGIVIHPPISQPFYGNQHTFVIENRSEQDAKDVVIEISVPTGDRIIGALPDNSVTSDQLSIFKIERIAAGERTAVHVRAISDDASPIEFSASLVSKAVYSFRIQNGQHGAKLSNVSYPNEKSAQRESQDANGDGTVDQRP